MLTIIIPLFLAVTTEKVNAKRTHEPKKFLRSFHRTIVGNKTVHFEPLGLEFRYLFLRNQHSIYDDNPSKIGQFGPLTTQTMALAVLLAPRHFSHCKKDAFRPYEQPVCTFWIEILCTTCYKGIPQS